MIKYEYAFLNYIIKLFNFNKNGFYIDCTYGEGMHSREILSKLSDKGRLFSFDRDLDSIKRFCIKDSRLLIINDNFSLVDKYMNYYNLIGKIDGVIFDLGMSNFQISDYSRGFSFNVDGPLDMRMNRRCGLKASDWINTAKELDIRRVIRDYGEEFYAKKISRNIVKYRKFNKILTTFDLCKLINLSVKSKSKFKNKSTRTFQAIRIFINDELNELKKALRGAYKVLKKNGVLLVISFHSLEDRIVKNFIKSKSTCCILDDLPLTFKQISKLNSLKMIDLGKFKPNKMNIKNNKRIRSAILRVAKKI